VEAEEVEEPGEVYPTGPVARPMPPLVQPGTGGRRPRPVARPYPTQTAPPTRPVTHPGRAAPPIVERRPVPPPVAPRPQQPPPSPPLRRRPPRELHVDLPSEQVETELISERRLVGLPSEQPSRERKRRPRREREAEFETVQPLLAQRPARREAPELSAEHEELLAFIQHPTRQSLRQAILMNEILGSPVGLRSFEDKF
jgi:hypothetical protein